MMQPAFLLHTSRISATMVKKVAFLRLLYYLDNIKGDTMRHFIVIFAVLIACFSASAGEPLRVVDLPVSIGTDTSTKYAMRIPSYGSIVHRSFIIVKDTYGSGLAGDSIGIKYGYRLETVLEKVGSAELTYVDTTITLDSIILVGEVDSVDTTGVGGGGVADTIYSITSSTGDTARFAPYVGKVLPYISPSTRQYIVFWVKPIAGQRKGSLTSTVKFIVPRVVGSAVVTM